MKKKCRIIKITQVNGDIYYQIQRYIWLFGWRWIPADWTTIANHTDWDADYNELRNRLCYYDGTKQKIEVIE